MRGGAEGETYHAEAAGAGAACEGAPKIALISRTPHAFEMARLLDLPRARRHASPRRRLRSNRTASPSLTNAAVAKASDGRAQPRAQWRPVHFVRRLRRCPVGQTK